MILICVWNLWNLQKQRREVKKGVGRVCKRSQKILYKFGYFWFLKWPPQYRFWHSFWLQKNLPKNRRINLINSIFSAFHITKFTVNTFLQMSYFSLKWIQVNFLEKYFKKNWKTKKNSNESMFRNLSRFCNWIFGYAVGNLNLLRTTMEDEFLRSLLLNSKSKFFGFFGF